ncbi:hypothetical protein BRADI_4g05091v3 [Brachypodium distachyon]|uniref:BTB domain-containing protein n=1 Tax=Brachypodium distachyon TaxID=15368 RepID=A0A0Q3PBF4_BRADI|nr:hypothetical protein BRADI_4g05091v3 [Brachypodium distachyon]
METAGTTSLTDAARLVQLLKIDGYGTTKAMSNDRCTIASEWHVDGYGWEIRIYPDASTYPHPNSWVALDLTFRSHQPRTGRPYVRATLGCRLVDPRGILKPSKEKTETRLFCRSGDSSSTLLLMKRQDLEASGYLKDDALTLQCTITKPAVPSSNLHKHIAELLQSEKGADVEFLVSGESFAAHKAVLAARSPVLMAQFYGDMMEKSCPSVEIKDMDAAVFKALLHFIYADDDTVPESAVMAQHLLAAADRYGLDRLKAICEAKLCADIEVETAVATLALAEQHGCGQLKDRCVEFIVGSPTVLDAVMATEGYRHLEASCPSVLTDLLARAAKKLKRA